jgi:hypothetical protein
MYLVSSFALLLLVAAPLSAQTSKRRCTGEAPDSAALHLGPVYRDCEVDRPARLRTVDLPVDYNPPTGGLGGTRCLRAEFQFVVDTTGRAELASVRPGSSNDRGLENAIRGSLPQVRYEPARLAGAKVRQVVVYARAVSPLVRVNPDDEKTGVPQVRVSAECP